MTSDVTARQRDLYRAVRELASSIDEQLMVISVLARRLACSQADIRVVRELLLGGHTKEESTQ